MKSLFDDRSGNFAILAACTMVPLALGAGLAIDFSTISNARSDLQQALDTAALAIQSQVKEATQAQADALAQQYLAANFHEKLNDVKVLRSGTTVRVSAQTPVKLAFGALMGYGTWPIVAASSADVAFASYEIALVLDTTGSMKGGKLEAMQDAVIGLVDSMTTQVEDAEKLKFAMVPFAAFVNVGPGYGPKFKKEKQVSGTGAAWLDLKGTVKAPQSEFTTGASRFQIYENLGKKWPGCVETRYSAGSDLDVDDTAPNAAKPETLFMPAFAIDEPDAGYGNSYITSDAKPNTDSVTEKKKRWKKYGVDTDALGNPLNGGLISGVTGLLIDPITGQRQVALNPADAAEVATNKKGPGAGCDIQPIMPLNYDYKKLKKNVGDLKAAGTTNIMEGVAWGNRVLSPGEPFSESMSASEKIERIMIVLTDGANNFGNNGTGLGSTYSAEGYLVDGRLGITAGGSSATNDLMNKRTLAACDVAKKAGIEIYTIRLEEPDVKTGTMLKECASAPDHYFDVPSRTQLDEAFGKIGQKISKVRLSS